MSSESVCQVARSWVDVGSFHTRLVVRFMNLTASVRNILDTTSYFALNKIFSGHQRRHVVGWRVNRRYEDHIRVRRQETELTQLTDDKAIQSSDAAASRRILYCIQPP
jgi:hypothetical protein